MAVGVAGAIVVIVILAIWPEDHREESSARRSSAPVLAPKKSPSPAHSAVFPDKVILRPLPVTQKTIMHEWTAGDATTPAVIEKIAHNPDEFIRLVEENERIKRRQLVYRNETVPMLLDRARNSGEPLRSFTLPGLDGMEVEVEVTGTQLNQAANGGSVTGRVKGHFNSMVSVGFANGCESFNVLSPDEGIFLTADAREPGEVIVKEIDPNKYNPPAGNTPDFIETSQPLPESKTH